MDASLRQLERSAETVEEQARLLLERLRAGLLVQGMGGIRLAAHLLDPVALRFFDDDPGNAPWGMLRPLGAWLKSFAKLNPEALVRAAVAAAECSYDEWLAERGWYLNWGDPPMAWKEPGDGLTHISLSSAKWESGGAEIEAPGVAIRAARRYVDDPTADNLEACLEVETSNLPVFAYTFLVAVTQTDPSDAVAAIQFAAKVATEEAVRKAICARLAPWALEVA